VRILDLPLVKSDRGVGPHPRRDFGGEFARSPQIRIYCDERSAASRAHSASRGGGSAAGARRATMPSCHADRLRNHAECAALSPEEIVVAENH